jgi:hypothetical protein
MGQYLDNIDDCLLDIFEAIMDKHDYKLLLISGEYDQDEASAAWFKMYDEYNEAVKSKSVNLQFELTKQIEIQKNEYTILKNCLFLIIEMHKINLINSNTDYDIDEYITIINNYGYAFDKNKGVGPESERVNKQLKNYLTRIESDVNKIEKLKEESIEWGFGDTRSVVEKFMGFAMNEKTTVKRFVTYLNRLINSQKDAK